MFARPQRNQDSKLHFLSAKSLFAAGFKWLIPDIFILLVVLSLFPVLVINFALQENAKSRAAFSEEQKHESLAQEFDVIINSASAKSFTESLGRSIFSRIASDGNPAAGKLLDSLGQRYDLDNCMFIHFNLSADFSRNTVTPHVFQAGIPPGKKQLASAFEYLVRLSVGQKMDPGREKLGKGILYSILGKRIIPSDVADQLKGMAFPVLYRQNPYFFVWDFQTAANGNHTGYFFITGNDERTRKSAIIKAVSDRKDSCSGFIKLFSDPAADVLLPEAADNQLFNKWRASFCVSRDAYLQTLQSGLPWKKAMGSSTLFCRQMPESDWVVFKLQREGDVANNRNIVFALNLFWSVIPVLGFCFRLLFGHWPTTGLKSRLIAVLLLAVILPVSLLSGTFFNYQQAFARYFQQDLQEKLRLSNEEFDHGQRALEADYQSVFAKITSSREIKENCQTWQSRPEEFAQAIKVFFENSKQILPVTAIALYDHTGFRFLSTFDNKSLATAHRFYDFYFGTMVSIVRKMLARSFPERILPDFQIAASFSAFKVVYEMLVGLNLDFEQEKRLGEVMWFYSKTDATGFIMGVIQGRENFAGIMVFFSMNNARKAIFERIREKLRQERPAVTSLAFDKTNQGLICLNPPESPEEREKIARIISMADANEGNLNIFSDGRMYLMQPSRKFMQTCFLSYTSIAGMQRSLSRNLLTFILFLVACLIILIFSAYLLYQRFMSPILDTTSLLDRLSNDDLSSRLEYDRHDEFGELKKEVDEIQNGLIQRKKLTAILSDHLVAMLDTAGNIEKIVQPVSFSGIALVSDIRQFTTISETQNAAQITSMLNTHFAAMALAITSNGGQIYKFIGDAIEAIFATNESCNFETAANNALKASFEMLSRMKDINDRRSELGLFNYKIGIGLASGKYVTGLIGDNRKRQDLTIVGSAIEKANKLEALSKQNPALPIVLEQKIARAVQHLSIPLKSISSDAPGDVFTFNAAELDLKAIVASRQPAMIGRSEQKSGRSSWLSSSHARGLIFMIGALFAILPIISFQQIAKHKLLSSFEANTARIDNQINNFVNLLKSKEAPLYFAEKILTDFSREISGKPVVDEQLVLRNLMFHKIQPEKLLIAVLNKKPGGHGQLQTLCRFGIDDNQMPDFVSLQQMLLQKTIDVMNLPPGQLFATFQSPRFSVPAVKNETMLAIDNLFLCRELSFRVFPYVVGGKRKAFFWCPLFNNAKPEGILFLTMPYSCIEQAAIFSVARNQKWPQTRISVYQNENTLLAEGSDAKSSDQAISVYRFEKIEFGGVPFSINFKSLIPVSKPSLKDYAVCIIFIILFLWAWFLTIFRQKAFAASIGRQFLLAMTFIILIPASILFYYLSSFELLEKSSLEWQQTRKLARELDQLERRPQLAFPVWLSRLRRLVKSEKLVNAYRESISQSSQSSPAVSEYLNREIAIESAPQDLPISIARVICVDRRGNSWINFSRPKGESNDLAIRSVLAGYCRFLFEVAVGESFVLTSGIGVQAQQEISLDAMLQVVRAMFGPESYADLTGQLDYHATLAAVTEQTAILVSPVSNDEKTELCSTVISDLPGIMPLQQAAVNTGKNNLKCYVRPASCYGLVNFPSQVANGQEIGNLIHQTAFTRTNALSRHSAENYEYLALTRFSILVPRAIMLAVAPLTDLIRKIEMNTRIGLGALLLLTLLIYGVVLIISRSITGPVEGMILALKLLREGEFRTELPVGGSDEIGSLCQKFNEMARKIQQREFIKTFVSSHALRFVEGSADESAPILPVQENQLLMFIETAIINEQSDEYARLAQLQASMQILCEEISSYGGDIDKVIGHKLLVCFYGKPQEALLKLMSLLGSLQKRSEISAFTAGVHFGKAASCLLGIGQQKDYTLIGDAVNTAARIHAAAKESGNNILFSESIVEMAADRNDYVRVCSMELKGKSGIFNLYTPAKIKGR